MGFFCCGCFCCRSGCRRAPTQPPGSRLPTLRLPTRLGVPSKLVWLPNAQRRAGRPRSSPRRFAAIVGYADGNGYQHVSRSVGTRASLAPTMSTFFVFGVVVGERQGQIILFNL
ncbi:MAG: hypothetical protein LBQ66_16485 [Planctomycetaceae bacterium]|nr:hypothetical protein [Planctomycetaceae bacterium]